MLIIISELAKTVNVYLFLSQCGQLQHMGNGEGWEAGAMNIFILETQQCIFPISEMRAPCSSRT